MIDTSWFVIAALLMGILWRMRFRKKPDPVMNRVEFWLRTLVNSYLLSRRIEPVYRELLKQYFPFYNQLSAEDQKLFEQRVQKFIDLKAFEPRGDIARVTPEMKVMVAGAAIQVTFGYPAVYFRHFWKILVYPENYFSTITSNYHQGEVNPRGIIVFSWKNFQAGFDDPADGRNLGLHEMAHAFQLENRIGNQEYQFIDRKALQAFMHEAQTVTTRLQSGQAPLFRQYAAANPQEFFAVAVEYFFEKPAELQAHYPHLFGLLRQILKIDPVNPAALP